MINSPGEVNSRKQGMVGYHVRDKNVTFSLKTSGLESFGVFRRACKGSSLFQLERNDGDCLDFLETALPTVRGAVASWLLRSTPDRAVQVRDLAEDIVLCSCARHFLFTQVYKWVLANLMLGVTLPWPSIPSRGE